MESLVVDWTWDTGHYPVAVASFVFSLLLHSYISPFLTSILVPTVSSLPHGKQLYWHSSVVSSVHAIVVSAFCVYSFMTEPQLKEDPIWGDSKTVKNSCAIVIGYMTADTIIMLRYRQHVCDKFFLCHHAASVFAYFYVMTFGVYVYFANFRLMAEFSTVFVNNRWMMAEIGWKSSQLYFYNGVVLTAVFFACRILCMPQCWYMIYSIYNTEPFMKSETARYVLISSCFALDILNVYWFYKLLKGVLRTLEQRKLDNNKNEERKSE